MKARESMAVSRAPPISVAANRFSVLDQDAVDQKCPPYDDSSSEELPWRLRGPEGKEFKMVYNSVQNQNPRISRLLKQSYFLPRPDKADLVPLRDVSRGLIRSAGKVSRTLNLDIPIGSVMKLCSLCESIFTKEHSEEWFDFFKQHPHHNCQASLIKSVAFGCAICLKIHAELHRQGRMIEEVGIRGSITTGGLSFSIGEDSDGWWSGYRFRITRDHATVLDFAIPKAESLRSHLTKAPLSTSTRYMDWDLVRYWLHECRSAHVACGRVSVGPKTLPTRLLEVSITESGLKAKLKCNIKDNDLEYVTLSHCWGRDKVFTLTAHNLERLCKDVPIDKLPQIFQDAMWVTTRLGLRHIWIDSLCICQGQQGRKDWLRELSRMSAVYQNGCCNLAGTGFADGRNGLFVSRHAKDIMPGLVKTNWIGSWNYPKGLRSGTYFIADDQSVESDVQYAPLNRRAWVVQERFLSPCTLHFGQRQVYWECSESICSEVFPAGLPANYDLKFHTGSVKFPWAHDINDPIVKQLAKGHDERLRKLSGWQHRPESLYRLWNKLVDVYSIGRLTRPSDKLPAISGIATHFRPLLNDQYIAGLWRKDIIRGLSWSVSPFSVTQLQLEYRAPSWSWASIDAKISCEWCYKSKDRETIIAEVVGVRVTTLDKTGIGPVTSGYLTLSGQLFPLQLDAGESSFFLKYNICGKSFDEHDLDLSLDMAPKRWKRQSTTFKAQGDGTWSVHMDVQTALSLFQGRLYIFLLRIDEDLETEEPHVICLLLGFCGHIKGQYIRIGMCAPKKALFEPVLVMENSALDEELYDQRIECADGTKFQVTIV